MVANASFHSGMEMVPPVVKRSQNDNPTILLMYGDRLIDNK